MNKNIQDDYDLMDDDFEDEIIEDIDDEIIDESFDEFDTSYDENASVHKIWLDTEPYLNQIYLSITNQKLEKIRVIKNGKVIYKRKPMPIAEGIKPLANDLGISQIMGICRTFLSSPLVQGNFDNNSYHNTMLSLSIKINRSVFANRLNWGIKKQDISLVLALIEESISIYLTRTINNLERARDKYNPNTDNETKSNKGMFDKLSNRFNKRRGIAKY